jgi:hypothetical protein
MGLRLRLRAGVDVAGFPYQARVILRAMRTHGLVVADNGSSGFIGGVPDERWDNDALHQLRRVTLADFEAVDTAPLRISPASAAARGAPRPARAARPARPTPGKRPAVLRAGPRRFLQPEPLAAAAAGLSVGSPAPAQAPGTSVEADADRGAEPAGLLPQVLTVILGLTAAALAFRSLRRTHSRDSRRR